MELVYLGVIAQARGRGLGYALTRYAQWMTRQAGRGKLVLAVDADNAKALRLYAEAGFQSWDRRSVLVAFRPDGKAR
jgi:ribosomal protein S18 acetylase RimI-like enzyme